jgi:hypothetical protein
MVERFNGRIGSEVLGVTIYSHTQLEHLLRGLNAAYNGRRQRVLNGKLDRLPHVLAISVNFSSMRDVIGGHFKHRRYLPLLR